MRQGKKDSEETTPLRRAAEERFRQSRKREVDHPGASYAGPKLVHELQVHQIELEMQNEELIQSREKIEAILERYAGLYDFSPAGYFTLDSDGKILQVNLTGARLMGTARAQLVNRRFGSFVYESDRPAFNAFLANAFASRVKESCELALRKIVGPLSLSQPPGNRLIVQVDGTVGEEGQDCRAVVIDITDRKMIENAHLFLLQSGWSGEDFFQSLARYLAETLEMDFVCIDRLEGDCLAAQTLAIYHNGRFEDNVNYALKDTPCGDVVGKAICGFPKDVRHLFPKDAVLQDLAAESYLGTTLWSSDGKPIGLIAIISSQPKANFRIAESILKLVAIRAAGELERRQAEEALKEANTDLDRKVQERTLELSQRAAQLRALAAELTISEQRERSRLAKVLHDHLQQLLVAAKFRMTILSRLGDDVAKEASKEVEELIDESIAASRSLTADLSPPILHEAGLNAGLEWLTRRMADKYGLLVDLELEQMSDLPADLKVLLFESVRELLFNVVKHAHTRSSTVSLRRVDQFLQITVSDQGDGFDPALALKPGEPGSGFGLFSVRERLELFEGKLEIQSSPGQGSRIFVTVPMLQQTIVQAQPTQIVPLPEAFVSEQIPASVPERKIRLLLADDHAVVRQGIASVLSSEPDIDVVGLAANGREAVDLAVKLLPDVILMDISMPVLNGVEATRMIRNAFPDICIIGLSMFEEAERAQAMRDAGAMDYITKSGPAEELINAIRTGARVFKKTHSTKKPRHHGTL